MNAVSDVLKKPYDLCQGDSNGEISENSGYRATAVSDVHMLDDAVCTSVSFHHTSGILEKSDNILQAEYESEQSDNSEREAIEDSEIEFPSYLLSVAEFIHQIHDDCSAMTFYSGFRTALLRMDPSRAPGRRLYALVARLLLATDVPRRMVVNLGSAINYMGHLDNNLDPPDLLLVKEWDALRLEKYQREQQAHAARGREME